MTEKPTVFISSTSIGLPEHRQQVTEACRRMGYNPVGMETWPAQDADAETVCLREVDRSDLFIGIYAFRYGWVTLGDQISITELEYDRTVESRWRSMIGRGTRATSRWAWATSPTPNDSPVPCGLLSTRPAAHCCCYGSCRTSPKRR